MGHVMKWKLFVNMKYIFKINTIFHLLTIALEKLTIAGMPGVTKQRYTERLVHVVLE